MDDEEKKSLDKQSTDHLGVAVVSNFFYLLSPGLQIRIT